MSDPIIRLITALEGSGKNHRILPLIIATLLLPLGCGGKDDPTGPTSLEATTTALRNGVENVDYGTETLTATGGDGSYSWALASGSGPLPTGLTLATNGDITGTPTVVGSQSFMVQVASGDGQTAQQMLSITVSMILQPSELCSDHSEHDIATFEDANLEARLRGALSVGAQEDLTCGLISGLTRLATYSALIESLVGVQNLTGLTLLNLMGNSISDISALSELTSLRDLQVYDNSIIDISALSGLTSLTDLWLDRNRISDISSLSGLTSLRKLILGGNSITDISALSGLTNLWHLYLENNPNLTDIQPLLDNTGLGSGFPLPDQVTLTNTNVSCTDVALLEAKGVIIVDSDCP